MHPAVREARAVAFDQRELVAGGGAFDREPVEQAGERIGRGHEAGGLVAEQLLDADVHHFLAEAVAVRNEVAA